MARGRKKGCVKYGGRPKGGQNKLTVEVKAMIEGALHDLGGQAWLVEAARENPAAFLQLVGKLIPRDLNVAMEIALSERMRSLIARPVE